MKKEYSREYDKEWKGNSGGYNENLIENKKVVHLIKNEKGQRI